MAKACMIRRNKRRAKQYKGWKAKRTAAQNVNRDPNASPEEKLAAQKLLQKTRDGSIVRLRRICKITGRPRGNSRWFGVCNKKLRELIAELNVPGVTKSSW